MAEIESQILHTNVHFCEQVNKVNCTLKQPSRARFCEEFQKIGLTLANK